LEEKLKNNNISETRKNYLLSEKYRLNESLSQLQISLKEHNNKILNITTNSINKK